jgi:YVTN family beta-propeller protein
MKQVNRDDYKSEGGGAMRRSLLSLLFAALAVIPAGCGGSKAVVAVTISPTTGTVKLEQTLQFSDTVTGNSDTSVTWSVNNVTGGNASVGTITTQGLYTAPANALNASSVTVAATSVADTSKSASATVTISSGATVTVFPTSGVSLQASETYQFTDTVTNTISNSNQSTAVYWYVNSVQGGNSTTGTITNTGLYTAPSQIGTSTTFVVKATLQADSTSSGQTNVAVVPAGAPTLSNIHPPNVATGAYFEDVYLNGSNFVSTSVARANGTPVATSFISSSVLRARIPAANLSAAGTVFIDVAQQSGALSSIARLTVSDIAPTLISTTPDSTQQITQNPGSVGVNLDGGYYTSETVTEFNGVVRASTIQNSRQLSVTLDPSDIATAGLFPVSVRNNSSGITGQISAANLAVRPGVTPQVLTTLTVGNNPNAVAINTATGIAVIANSGSNSLTLIDLNAADSTYLQQVGTITVGTSPSSVAVDNSRNLAVVANNGSNSVSIVDLSAKAVKATIASPSSVDSFPYAVGVNPLTGRALLAYQNSSTATIIDLDKLAVSATGQIPTTGSNPQVTVEPRFNWGIVTPGGNGSMSVVDLTGLGRSVVSLIAVPSSNGAVRKSGTVTITTTDTLSVTTGQSVDVEGVNDASFDGVYQVASASGTTFTYTQSGSDTTSGNGTVSVAAPLVTVALNQNVRGIGINTETEQAVLADPSSTSVTFMSLLDQSVSTLALETGTTASAVNPLTNVAVTVNSIGNQASLLDLQTQSRIAQLTVGRKPVAVAVDPVTNIALTVNQTDNTVTLIQLGTIRPLQVVQVSPFSVFNSATTSQTVTLVGNGFNSSSTVRLNEAALATTFVSSRELTALVPASMLSGPTRYVVDVKNVDNTQSNVTDFTVIQTVPVGTAPRGIALDRERNLAVVTNSGSKSVSIINTSTFGVSGTLNVGTSPEGVAVSSLAGRAAVTNTDDDTVSIIDLDNIAVSTTVSVAPSSGTSKPIGIAIHPGSGQVVVADSNATQVSFFNVTSPGTPTTLTVDAGPNAVAIDPTRNIAAVSEGASSEVVIIDLSTKQILNRVTGFSLPTGAIFDPDSDTFLVTSSLANDFGSVIARPDTGSYTVTFNKVGINPTSIDYNYRSGTLLTTNTSSQTISIMDFLTKTIKAVIPIPVSQQFAVAIDPNTNRAIVVDQNNNRVLFIPLPK